MMVDAWAPPVIAAVYATLVRAHPVFDKPYQAIRLALLRRPLFVSLVGFDRFKYVFPSSPTGLDPLEARAVCAIILAVFFALRALYNFGGDLGLPKKLPKIRQLPLPDIPKCAYPSNVKQQIAKSDEPFVSAVITDEKVHISSSIKKKKKKKAKHGSAGSEEL